MDSTAARPMIDLDVEELRAPVLRSLCTAGIVFAWIWVAVVAPPSTFPPSLKQVAPPLILLSVSVVCLAHRSAPLPWRSVLFVVGASCALIVGSVTSAPLTWLYYQSVVVGIAGLLVGPVASLVAALLLTASSVLVATQHISPSDWGVAVAPLGLLWATAITSWLSSRNLYTALSWALTSQSKAWQTANEVRSRRAELRRTLDSLRTTYSLLERTTRELKVARREADEARQIKSRFVANISHELRTPLNIIVGFAEMLCTLPEAYGDASWPPMVRDDLFTIWRNAQHLLSMIDDVLDLAQIEARRMPIVPEPTPLNQLVRDSLLTASSLLRDTTLELRVELRTEDLRVNLDPVRMRQVLLNLINNAVRFTTEGYIEVGSYSADGEAVVYVRDTGIGMAKDKLQAVFQEFEQADTSIRRPHQGSGLGLAICKHIVTLHGGRIWAESDLGHGSTFYLSLPIRDTGNSPLPARLQSTQPSGTPGPTEPPSMVVLARDALVRRLLERHMETLQVLQVETLADAVYAIRDRHPELTVVVAEATHDWQRAVRDAQSLVKATIPLDVPIIVCSLRTERDILSTLGAADCLLKPVTRDAVVSSIERICKSPQRILIVDDEPDMLRFLTRAVRHAWATAQVYAASSGEEAIALLGQRPDIILLDLLMPDMSGADVVSAVRADQAMEETPVVIITARGPEDDAADMTWGKIDVVRGRNFTAMELVHCLDGLSKCLPPHYVTDAGDSISTPEAGLA